MLRKDFESALRLHNIDKNSIKERRDLEPRGYYYNDIFLGKDSLNAYDNYYLVLENHIDWNIVEQVLRELEYFDCGNYGTRIDTKEGYTVMNSVTKEQYEDLKNLDKKYFGRKPDLSDRDLTLEEYHTLKRIYDFVIPKIYKNAEEYLPKLYDEMIERCYE